MSEKKHKGLLITLEGGEGGGKTTQIVRLRDRLSKAGKDVVVLREPGGTVISEQIRDVVLSAKNIGIAFTAEVLLFQAARAQIYREIVLPSLEAGKIVILDRSRDSSVVYQGMVRGFGKDMVEKLNDLSTKETYPDATFLLDLPVELGLQRRVESGKMDRLDMEGMDFHVKVRDAYLELAKADTHDRWHIIDASQSLEEVQEELWTKVKTVLGI
ncbi:MAG: dTMP kinase [Candidatus Pacebacteria bacterium]|nr:dTMP kinase [Candidatus Paceibacterota bacterium]PIR63275.1 MAG: dTMP kinase [Candidatus Pacebacteria bacterium CG10_big_fil_rev_8_21_14_0_10_40_26]PIZ79156.1 MAG: dTMP kinase [Candidatus Pacebacteria bacterium CG_4_10_14_0_2_um_filter_40_20]PJA68811.1 MAG: dTMP kinase [Candidatus Pacebacteria bacterium CG_4_9_14_3_um_filter_40_12]PJC42122.1 MAG: dTMP kinase [Candidatus Pacebacteria bacterium CG_4_9_14_0_2_um_filter_40_15]